MTQELYEVIFRGLQAKYPGQPIGPRWRSLCATLDGGEGSGNFGHEGRPGKVGGSGEGVGKKAVSKKDAQTLNAQEAEELYKSDWIKSIRTAIAQLPKSSNGRPYLQNGETVVDVPERLVGEVKKEILNNNKIREEKIGAVWAIHHLQELFSAAVPETPEPDVHRRKNIKSVIRYNIPFPLTIEGKNYAFNTKFTVREFEDGRKVLAPELMEINKGRDLGLYALKTKKEGPET